MKKWFANLTHRVGCTLLGHRWITTGGSRVCIHCKRRQVLLLSLRRGQEWSNL